MRTTGYRIAAAVVLGLFIWVCGMAFLGWGLATTASTRADRDAVRRHSARVGGLYVGGGTHYGK